MWDGSYSIMLIFRSKSSRIKHTHNITLLLSKIARFVKNNPLNGGATPVEFAIILETIWEIINAIYMLKWDCIIFDRKNRHILEKYIISQFVCKEMGISEVCCQLQKRIQHQFQERLLL